VTDDLNRTIVQTAADDARDKRAHRLLYLAFALAVVGIGALGWLYVSQSQHALEQDQRITRLVDLGNDAAKQSQQLADQVKTLGATPVVQPAQPAPAGPTIVTPVPIPGPGPTQAQIDAAVAAYLVAHPPAAGKSATPEMVATAVAEFLTAHPPTPGRPPTPEEIATAAATWFANHSAEFQGPAGKDATDAQVAAAVDAYCSAHGSCAGKPGATGAKGESVQGPQGPQGVSFTDLQFVRNSSGKCQAIATFHDPATGKDSTVTHPAGDAACPTSGPIPLIPTR
jgi:hypothetical protein